MRDELRTRALSMIGQIDGTAESAKDAYGYKSRCSSVSAMSVCVLFFFESNLQLRVALSCTNPSRA
jgi:hypothetical protein